MKILAMLLFSVAPAFAAGPIPPSGCPLCIQNTATPQDAQINIGTGTIRGTLTVSTLAVTNLQVVTLTATNLVGGGAGITALNASALASGTVPSARVAGAYTGITGVGTVAAGTWQGTAIGTQYGGTGQNWSTVNQGALPYFSSTGGLSTLAPGTVHQLLQANGPAANPSWTSAPTVAGTNVTQIPLANLLGGNLPQNVAINDASISTVSAVKVIGDISGRASGLTALLPLNGLQAGTLSTTIVASSITPTGVLAGTYPALTSQTAQLVVRGDGRIASITQQSIGIAPTQISAGTLPTNVLVPPGNIQDGTLGVGVVAQTLPNSGVVAGVYGGPSDLAQLAVNAQGRVTSAAQFHIPGISTFTAIIDQDNNWSHAQTSRSSWTIKTDELITGTMTASAIAGNGSQIIHLTAANIDAGKLGPQVIASSVAARSVGDQQLTATGVTAGTYGDATHAAAVTLDAQGRTTSASSIPIVVKCHPGSGTASIECDGLNNSASGAYSVVSGGDHNSVSQDSSTIAGGSANSIIGDTDGSGGNWFPSDFIGGGYNNRISSQDAPSAILSGINNSIEQGGGENVIIGGGSNQIYSTTNMIGIGFSNAIYGGSENTILNGEFNYIYTGADSAILSGDTNQIDAVDVSSFPVNSVIAGGEFNYLLGDFSAIGGGLSNRSRGYANTIAGGDTNTTADNYASTVSGGDENVSNDYETTVGGGGSNVAGDGGDRGEATVAGGDHNEAFGYGAAIGGGSNNTISRNAGNSVIAGGVENTIVGNDDPDITFNVTIAGGFENTAGPGDYSAVSGGSFNTASGNGSSVIGGEGNLAAGLNSSVIGGDANKAYGQLSVAGGYKAYANALGSFVWSAFSNDGDPLVSDTTGQMLLKTPGGFEVLTTSVSVLTATGDTLLFSLDASSANFTVPIYGDGSHLTGIGSSLSLTTAAIVSGKFTDARVGITTGAITGGFNGANQLVQMDASGNYPAANGSAITNLTCNTSGTSSVLCSGGGNSAGGSFETVSGGQTNAASSNYSTICGGHLNTASGANSTACGGSSLNAAGANSFAAGDSCAATGDHSFCLGHSGAASKPGSFVWSDNTGTAASDSVGNSFVIGAAGGVWISSFAQVNGTMTVVGNKFSVGGSSFSVVGGSVAAAYSMTAAYFIGNGSLLTGISGSLTGGAVGQIPVQSGSGSTTFLPAIGSDGIIIGNGTSALPSTGTFAGTSNQVVITRSVAGITLSTPQDINSGATPTFTATNFSGVSGITGLGTQAQALNMGSHLINNVTDPVSAQDAATKNYVDTSVPSLDFKAPARWATTAALASNSYANGSSGVGATITGLGLGLLTVDGQNPIVGDRMLVKDEGTQSHNGLYTVTTNLVGAFFVLTRATDHDQPAEMGSGVLVTITSGTTNADTLWVQTSSVTTVGTDPVTFVQTSGLGDVAAGTGLSKSGNTISLTTPILTSYMDLSTFTLAINGKISTVTVNASMLSTGIGSASLPVGVDPSSVAILNASKFVPNFEIDPSSIAKLSAGLIPNWLIDKTSITAAGNNFNMANGPVKTDANNGISLASATLTATGTGIYALTLSTSMHFAAPNTGILWADGTISTTASSGGGGGGSVVTSAVSTVTLTWAQDNFLGQANGSQTTFTLSQTPSSSSAVFVFLDGLRQGASDYSISGLTITMTTAPLTACNSTVLTHCTSGFEADYTINTSTLPGVAVLSATNTFIGANIFSSSFTVQSGLHAISLGTSTNAGSFNVNISTLGDVRIEGAHITLVPTTPLGQATTATIFRVAPSTASVDPAGDVELDGQYTSNGTGGAINLFAGAGTTAGGNVVIKPGAGPAGSSIQLKDQNGNVAVQVGLNATSINQATTVSASGSLAISEAWTTSGATITLSAAHATCTNIDCVQVTTAPVGTHTLSFANLDLEYDYEVRISSYFLVTGGASCQFEAQFNGSSGTAYIWETTDQNASGNANSGSAADSAVSLTTSETSNSKTSGRGWINFRTSASAGETSGWTDTLYRDDGHTRYSRSFGWFRWTVGGINQITLFMPGSCTWGGTIKLVRKG